MRIAILSQTPPVLPRLTVFSFSVPFDIVTSIKSFIIPVVFSFHLSFSSRSMIRFCPSFHQFSVFRSDVGVPRSLDIPRYADPFPIEHEASKLPLDELESLFPDLELDLDARFSPRFLHGRALLSRVNHFEILPKLEELGQEILDLKFLRISIESSERDTDPSMFTKAGSYVPFALTKLCYPSYSRFQSPSSPVRISEWFNVFCLMNPPVEVV